MKQEQSIGSGLTSIDFFSCITKYGKTGACILSVRDGKIRGTKTYYFNDDYSDEQDSMFQSLFFSFFLKKSINNTLQSLNLLHNYLY